MEEALIDGLILAACANGKRSDSGYKREAWEHCKKKVQEACYSGQTITRDQLKNKHDTFKREYKTWKELSNLSGFAVNEDGTVSGDSDALDRYYEAHPDARKYRTQPLRFADKLSQLFDGIVATGQDAVTIESLLPAASIESSPSTVRSPSTYSIPSNRSSTPRGRAGYESDNRKSKRAVADRLARKVGDIAEQLEAMVRVMDTDHQRDALLILMSDFMVLHPQLLLKLTELLESELKAKAFKLWPANMRYIWARRELLRARDELVSVDFSLEEFQEAIDAVKWEGEGALTLVERVECESTMLGIEVDSSDVLMAMGTSLTPCSSSPIAIGSLLVDS